MVDKDPNPQNLPETKRMRQEADNDVPGKPAADDKADGNKKPDGAGGGSQGGGAA